MNNHGVIHCGAHLGEEIPGYLLAGYSHILCFEPQFAAPPDLPPEVTWVQMALSDRERVHPLYVPVHLHDSSLEDTMSASLLPPDWQSWAKLGWPQRERVVEHVVAMTRFDTWADAHELDIDFYQTLVIDVQGAELEVLRGFGQDLAYLSRLTVECSAEPIYKGGASAEQVIDFLAQHGFVYTSPIQQHGDITFVRRSHP